MLLVVEEEEEFPHPSTFAGIDQKVHSSGYMRGIGQEEDWLDLVDSLAVEDILVVADIPAVLVAEDIPVVADILAVVDNPVVVDIPD